MLKFFVLTAVAMSSVLAVDDYKLGPDSQFKADVPHGRVEKFRIEESKVFPGTARDGWVYVPAQYDPNTPAALMVFQDGGGDIKRDGNNPTPNVMDNLVAQKKIPVMI